MDKVKKERLWRYGLLAGALIVSPIIFMVIQGLIGIAIAGVLGLAICAAAPVVSMKAANLKVKAIKAEAAANPIETLQNQWIGKKTQIGLMAQDVTKFGTETKNFQDKVRGFQISYPKRAAEFQKQSDNMQKVLDIQRARLSEANHQLDLFEDQIKEASAVWDMTQAAMKASKSMSKFSNADAMETIKSQTAIDSVTSSLNQVMSDLETAIAMDYNTIDADYKVVTPGQLTNDPSPSLLTANQMTAVKVPR